MIDLDWQGKVRALWRALDSLQEGGFSLDPRDLAHNVAALWAAINRVAEIATDPPPGEPAAIEAAAERWRSLADALDVRAAGLEALVRGLPEGWRGAAADGCAATVRTLGGRYEAAVEPARVAARSLSVYASELGAAVSRHRDVGELLHVAGGRIAQVRPWSIPETISDVLRDVREAARAAIESYTRAGEATSVCARALDRVSGDMPFPATGAPGLSAFDLIDLSIPGQERRPLVGDVAARAARAYDALSVADQQAMDALLDGAPSADHRAWILAALASGHPVAQLAAFATRIDRVRAADLAALLDPTAQPAGTIKQQSSTTCGSASLVVAHMLNDPVYALSILDADPGEIATRFAAEELVVKARTNDAFSGPDPGDLGLPWPDAVGTPPWGASEEMNGTAGVPGTSYSATMIDSDSAADRQQSFDAVARAADAGRTSPLFVGDDAVPRHVVLVVGRTEAGLQVYEPGAGNIVTVSEADFVSGNVDLGGWERPWAAIAP